MIIPEKGTHAQMGTEKSTLSEHTYTPKGSRTSHDTRM